MLSVNTEDGLVVLAGEAVYTYEHLKYDVSFPFGIGGKKQLTAYKRVREILGGFDGLFVPWFDMEVFRRFPKISDRVVQIRLK